MTEITLSDVGVERFNDDHQRLLFCIMEFHRLSLRFQQREPVEDEWDQIHTIFPRLEKYTQEHFFAEEELMREENYPHLQQHIQQHNGLVQHIKILKTGIENRNNSQIAELDTFLINWLQNHINKEDLQYRGFFKQVQTRKIYDTALFNEMISASQLNQIIENNPPDAVILDVRTATEYQEGIIPGSHLFPCDHNLINRQDLKPFTHSFHFNFNPDLFDPEKRYFLVCRSGPRTEIALEVFLENNLKACELVGGISEWVHQGYPTVPVTPETPRVM